jgi:hypothetical protein
MSRENVEVVQEGLRLWGLNPEGGLAPIDLDRLQDVFEGDTTAAAELFDPEVELHPPRAEQVVVIQRNIGRMRDMEIDETFRFCSRCGTAASSGSRCSPAATARSRPPPPPRRRGAGASAASPAGP